MERRTSSLQLFLSLAVVMHFARVLPVQSFVVSPSSLWPSSASFTIQTTFKTVCAEVLCSDHVPRVLWFPLPYSGLPTLTFTFTFGEDSMLSSAEAIVSFGPVCSPEITKRLYKSLRGFCNLKRVYG